MEGIAYDDKFLLMFHSKMVYFKSHYIYPSQLTLLKWLRTSGGFKISRRTLNRYLKELCKRGLISRIRRIRHNPHRGLQFNTTLYSIGIVGLMRLRQLGILTWKSFREWIKNSNPFRARVPKKEPKGISTGEPGFLKDYTDHGRTRKEPI